MNELYDKYPKYKNIKGIDLQRWRICPVGVASDHEDIGITITEETAEKFANEIEHTPLMYGQTEGILPKNHGDKDNKKYKNRKVIGTGLGGGVTTDENGSKWLFGDYLVYADTDEEIMNKIKEFKDNVSSSYEINNVWYDDDGNVVDADYKGTAIMDKEYSAYHHKALMVAEKTNIKENSVDTESKELLKKIYDLLNVNTKLVVDEVKKELEEELDKTKESIEYTKENIKEAEKNINKKPEQIVQIYDDKQYWKNWKEESEQRLKEKEEELERLKLENDKLRELTNGFANLK
jgi:hypothetical protein